MGGSNFIRHAECAVSSLIARLGNTGSRMFVNNEGYLDIGTFAERNLGLLKAMMVKCCNQFF